MILKENLSILNQIYGIPAELQAQDKTNLACRNQTATSEYCLVECTQWRDARIKYKTKSNTRTLLGRDCEVEKVMKFLKNIS